MDAARKKAHHDPHTFTEQTNPRLTFIVGIVIGVTIMTAAGVGFFSYVLSGGQVVTFDIEPLEVSQDILEEPISEIDVSGDTSLSVDDTSHIVGAFDDFDVTLVQYIDYECLFCRKFFPEVRKFAEDNSDSVRLIVKHDPLTKIHPHAKSAAVAAECAGEQDKFLEYTSYLFDNQSDLSDELYTQAASELELDTDAFATCLTDEAVIARVEEHAIEAEHLGITSQPNLVVWHNDNSIDLIDGYVGRDYLDSLLVEPAE